MKDASLTVRLYRDSDETDVVTLWRLAFPNDPPWNDHALVIQRKVAERDELFLVGEVGGRVVATVLAGYDGFRGWVYHVATSPTMRRQGIGRAMMQEAERRLRALGCPKLNLQVRSSNHEVIEFYKRLGYDVEDRVSFGKRLD